MNTQFNLEIKKPCLENYDQFRPTEKGGFCDNCQKEVIDFTQMNNKEIVNYFKTRTTNNTCGRFNTQQLRTPFKSPQKKYLNFFTGLGLTLLSFFSITPAEAQEQNQSTKKVKDSSSTEELKNKERITVKGTVVTEEDGLPLPGASVILQGTAHGIQTDFDGFFEFPKKLKKGDVLIISYVGLESQKVIIENKKSATNIELKVNMEYTSCVIMGEVAVKEIFKSKRN
ncbi:carboxypeptidase-like regulatory domain-containing protein [Winogradskyella luteola]|uniref:Carboxypeptidase-like regulatory domain-containing protein n=1 Tax=Winogradskyella luteola TaxID=2828330 RepID=A0A9X1FB08_9FLAO|nr:carboxypeptidase-like regulatory domain-containing protein [Winogradskyella luteola]MBV7270556.1 carboxypeptidase-like regulatory domain-containing protein [Winogradskyella luteola]